MQLKDLRIGSKIVAIGILAEDPERRLRPHPCKVLEILAHGNAIAYRTSLESGWEYGHCDAFVQEVA